jgi:hypothetical protein
VPGANENKKMNKKRETGRISKGHRPRLPYLADVPTSHLQFEMHPKNLALHHKIR